MKTVLEVDLDMATKVSVTRAVNKLMGIQNDLFARPHANDLGTRTGPKGVEMRKVWFRITS